MSGNGGAAAQVAVSAANRNVEVFRGRKVFVDA